MSRVLLPHEHDRLPAEWIHLSHSHPASNSSVWPASNRLVLFHCEGETMVARRFRIGTCTPLDDLASRFSFSFADNSHLSGPYPPTAWMPLTAVKKPSQYGYR